MRKSSRVRIHVRLTIPRDANMAKRLFAVMLMQIFRENHSTKELASKLRFSSAETSRYLCMRVVPRLDKAEWILAELQRAEPLCVEDLPRSSI
jgi:hypothetical protein